MSKRSTLLMYAVASVLLAAGAAQAQQTTAPDTSTWTCSKCPIDKGYRGSAELGSAYADEASAKFGDYTGIDEDGFYLLADASGQANYDSGYVLSYELKDLGLDSRELRVDGGKQGSYGFTLAYDRVPHRITDSAETVFGNVGGTSLDLPPGWVRAGSTSGMTALDANLRDVDVGIDRDRYVAAGQYLFGDALKFSLDYRRDERDGTRTGFGSFGSVSTQLLRPIDDATDRFNVAARYQGSRWFGEIGYYMSLYDTKAAALTWQNPFNSFVPAATSGRMALEPDNQYHEIAVSAGMHGLPWRGTLGFSAAMGEGSQDTQFLPYTLTPGIATDPLPAANLDGKVKMNRADLTLTLRPLDRLSLRGAVAWDERDNDSRQEAYTSIVHTDLFPVTDDRINALYGYDRLRVSGTADFDVYDDLTVGVGGEYRTLDRTGTTQEVKGEDLADGWVRAQYRPNGYLGFVIKGGVEERDPDRYDETVADGFGQNPLLRKYNMAYRYRSYGDFVANVAVGNLPLTLSMNAFYADDSYTKSNLGLIKGLDRRYGVDLTWAVNDRVSVYGTAGREKVSYDTLGSSDFATSDWRSELRDDFETWGGGMRAQFTDAVSLTIDYTQAVGDADTTLTGVAGGAFPTVHSKLNTLKADFNFGLGDRTDFVLSWWYERFESEDWALQGIDPDTMPTVLGLGIDPYNYSVNYIGASIRYKFGQVRAATSD